MAPNSLVFSWDRFKDDELGDNITDLNADDMPNRSDSMLHIFVASAGYETTANLLGMVVLEASRADHLQIFQSDRRVGSHNMPRGNR